MRKVVLKMGNPILNQVSDRVADPTSIDIASLVSEMKDVLDAIGGNAISAPQIGINLRVVIYRLPSKLIPQGSIQKPIPLTCMINPVIEKFSGNKFSIWERCLSIPGLYGQVLRHREISFHYTTLEGFEVHKKAHGFHAMTLQHECDHLDGILYPMRMTDLSTLRYISEMTTSDGYYCFSPQEFD